MSTLLQAFHDTPQDKRVHIGSGHHRHVWSIPHIAGIVFKTVRCKEYGSKANIAELRLWEYLTSEPDWDCHASWLTPIVAGAEDGSIVAMVQVNSRPEYPTSFPMHLAPSWIRDNHPQNMGIYRDRVVQLDYGLFYHHDLPKPSAKHTRASTKTFPLSAW